MKNLTNDGHAQYHTQVKNIVLASEFSEIIENLSFVKYCEAIAVEYEISKKISKSEFTALIEGADGKRSGAYRSITDITTANTRSFEADMKESAVRVKIVLDNYGDITKKRINDKTSAIRDLIEELDGRLKPDCVKLGIDKWVKKLDEYNKEFEDLMMTRYSESASRVTVRLRDHRPVVDSLCRDVMRVIDAFMTINGEAKYINLVNLLNVVAAKYAGKRSVSASNTAQEEDSEDNGGSGTGDNGQTGDTGNTDPYPDAREWNPDIDYQTCKSGDIFYIVRNGVKEYYKLLDFGEVTSFEPGMDDGGIWEKIS